MQGGLGRLAGQPGTSEKCFDGFSGGNRDRREKGGQWQGWRERMGSRNTQVVKSRAGQF